VSHQRAEPQRAVAFLDAVQTRDPVDVDQMLGRREPEFHHRDQALASRQDLGVLAVLGEQRQGLVERGGPVVLESRWQHAIAPSRASGGRTTIEPRAAT